MTMAEFIEGANVSDSLNLEENHNSDLITNLQDQYFRRNLDWSLLAGQVVGAELL